MALVLRLESLVRAPGVQPITDVPMTLAEALNRAGGATALGDTSRLQLSRGGQTTSLNLPGMVAAGIHPGQLLLRSGDLLRVPVGQARLETCCERAGRAPRRHLTARHCRRRTGSCRAAGSAAGR